MSQTTQIPQTVDFAGLEVAEISTVPSDADLDYAWRGDAYGLSASELPQDLYTMSPEFEMVGTGRDTGLQANYDFLQSNDPLMQSVLNSTMVDSISLDGSYLANMPAMTHESGMSYEERNSLDPEAYHFTAEIPKGGDNFNQLYSKFIGVHAVDAAEYYVDQRIKSDNPLWSIPAGLALLATPENAGKTGLVLGGAGIASAFMTAYRAAGVLGVAEEGALIAAETASSVPLPRRWDIASDPGTLAGDLTYATSHKSVGQIRFEGSSALSKHEQSLFAQLDSPGSHLILDRKAVSMDSLRRLSAATPDNVEFALLTRGNQRLVIRGGQDGSTNVGVWIGQPGEAGFQNAYTLSSNGWRWSGHTHPYTGRVEAVPGPADLDVLNYIRAGQRDAGLKVQQNSGIWNLDGAWGLIDNGK